VVGGSSSTLQSLGFSCSYIGSSKIQNQEIINGGAIQKDRERGHLTDEFSHVFSCFM